MLVLASTSPRRVMLLREGGYQFAVIKASVPETLPEEILPSAGAKELAVRKAEAGRKYWLKSGGDPQDIVLGADTIVVLDAQILGKPETSAEAEEMLTRLSGRTHRVLTGVALISGEGECKAAVVETVVRFRQLSLPLYIAGTCCSSADSHAWYTIDFDILPSRCLHGHFFSFRLYTFLDGSPCAGLVAFLL